MSVALSMKVPDKSTCVVSASFFDSAGNPATPTSLTWTMTNGAGSVVNGRSAVLVAAPSTSVDIVLGADDTDHEDGERRIIVFDAIYNSTEGNDLPLRGAASFRIEDLRG